MKISSNYLENMEQINSRLTVKESFDIIERTIIIGGKHALIYYLSGFVKDDIMQQILRNFFNNISESRMESYTDINSFIDNEIPHVSVEPQKDLDKMIDGLLTGQTVIIIDGFDSAIVMDLRAYAGRSTSEPAKEKTLRGSKDGFVEKIILNSALIRRRIRDPRLICEMHSIGYISKTDVCLVYLDKVVDKRALDVIIQKINSLSIGALTVGDQSLVDLLLSKNWLNPLPKIRYTERPDVAAAHIVEGKIVILVDNSPTAMILPTGIFDFLQDVNDYYFPNFTGNYLRLIRNVVIFFNIFLIPVFILFANGNITLPSSFDFIRPEKPSAVSITTQFIILEIAVDGLKLASLNTPDPLGSSLSIIGGLILGQYAVTTGWFTNETILYSAVVSLAGFAQPSIELNYAFKFLRTLLIILCGTIGFWGLILGTVIGLIVAASTKTITGEPYFYPLIPFNWIKLKNLIFRTRISNKVQ
ncbi:spore germination protein [Clostridium saccharobutylicum]|uniref:Spore germination protein A1 n=1 Tax=Clostridium saccharobutylicum TaxID=169679 RepID=A0A1S8MRC7_CLOSA|nr:spore germination protein [Clostridium saccharobutylicum]OOM06718.1 spore germination protein A1 [Clostridium saccharobutylicum]